MQLNVDSTNGTGYNTSTDVWCPCLEDAELFFHAELSQPSGCERLYAPEDHAPTYSYTASWNMIIGALVFLSMVVAGLYLSWRAGVSMRHARVRVITDMLEMLQQADERGVPLFVQAEQPDGEVCAARRCPDEEQTPGPEGLPPPGPATLVEEERTEGGGGDNNNYNGSPPPLVSNREPETGFLACLRSGPLAWLGYQGGDQSSEPVELNAAQFAGMLPYNQLGLREQLISRFRNEQRHQQARRWNAIQLNNRVNDGNNARRNNSGGRGQGSRISGAAGAGTSLGSHGSGSSSYTRHSTVQVAIGGFDSQHGTGTQTHLSGSDVELGQVVGGGGSITATDASSSGDEPGYQVAAIV